MANVVKVGQTRGQRRTDLLKARFREYLDSHYPNERKKFPDEDFYFSVEDSPFQVWSCVLVDRRPAAQHDGISETPSLNDEAAKKLEYDNTIWLFWDGSEITSFSKDNSEGAFVSLIDQQRARRRNAKLKYFTSPLTVSAVLAMIMLLLIALLAIIPAFINTKIEVPQQLWTVFTAVVAFYFGKENTRGKSVSEEDT